jgi:hypothetical protein
MVIDIISLMVLAIPLNIISFLLEGKSQMYYMIFEITFLLTIWLCKDLIGGRSFGKRIQGHVLCNIDNTHEIWRFIVRNIFTFVWPIEILFCFINPSRKLGDLLFGTKIIYVKEDKSNLIKFQKQAIVISFIVTFFTLLIIISAVWYLIWHLNFPMIKLLYS